MLGTDDIVGIIGRAAYSGIDDQLSNERFDQLEDLDFWNDVEDDGDEGFWIDKDFEWDFYDGDEKSAAKKVSELGGAAAFRAVEEAQDFTSPERWMAKFENGRIPLQALDKVADGHYLRPDVAKAAKRMERAARKDGVTLTYTDTYRTYDSQVRLAQEKGLYSQGGLAAEPGTSNHGWGTAIDYGETDDQRAWLATHGAKFGFKTIPREPWHWEWDGSVDPGANAFRGKSGSRKPQQRPRQAQRPGAKGASVAAVEGVGYAPEFSTLTALPGAVLGLLGEPIVERVRPPKKSAGGGAQTSHRKVPSFVPKREQQFFINAARATGLPVRLLAFVAKQESGFQPNKTTHSSAGAIGRMQLMPGTAQELGVDPYNLRENIMGGARYLAQQLKNFKGDLRKALAAYNAGPGNYQAGLGYADEILSAMRS